MSTFTYGGDADMPRKIRWWEWFTDSGVRQARRMRKRYSKDDVEMVVISTLPNGIDIVVPAEIAGDWDAMPDEVKSEFIAAITEHANEQRFQK